MSDTTTPIVFLHAFPLDSSMWSAEKERFRDRRTLAPDFPGFGGRPAASASLDEFADSVVREVVTAGIERAVFVGLSMGGYVAFRIWARHPERVAALVLADTRAGADTPEASSKRTEQADHARREGIGWLADAMVPKLLGETTREERPLVVDAVREMIERADSEGVAQALLAMRDRPDSVGMLSEIDAPVLAIAGAEDTLTPVSEARLIADHAPRGALVEIPRAGHLANVENPDAFADALTAFLKQL